MNNELTKHNDLFLVRFRKWIRNAALRQDDDGAMHCGSEPGNMCMPKKCASLSRKSEIVDIVFPRLNWTLCNVCWPIVPACSKLPNTMPAMCNKSDPSD